MVEQAIKNCWKCSSRKMKIANGRCSYGRYGYAMCGEKTTCPQWMAGEQLYNCENFTKTLRKAGFNLDRLFKQMRLSEQ